MKKFLYITLILLTVLFLLPQGAPSVTAENQVWDGTIASCFESGSGTQKDPYIIKTPAQLAFFAKTVNEGITYKDQYLKLTADIKLNDTSSSNWQSGAIRWTAIGYYNLWHEAYMTPGFYGTFNGNYHTISGLILSGSTSGYSNGLFGYIAKGGIVKNLGIVNSNLQNVEGLGVGAIAGHSEGSIINCYNTCPVSSDGSYVGGIVGSLGGYVDSPATVERCYNTGSVTGPDSVGGICGAGGGVIINCYNTGAVTGKERIGGICGNAGYSDCIETCYNAGSVRASRTGAGAIVGDCNKNTSVKNCFYLEGCARDGSDTPQNGFGSEEFGSVTINTIGATHPLSHSQMKKEDPFTGFDFEIYWTMYGDMSNPYPKLVSKIDSDKDGLYDDWEIDGIDLDEDGVLDLDLEAMGADPYIQDIFVEVDWMVRPEQTIYDWEIGSPRNLKPSHNAMKIVYEAFKAHNIHLHIDVGPDSVDFVTGRIWGELSGGNIIPYEKFFPLHDDNEFWNSIIKENFAEIRYKVFRHCIFADMCEGYGTSSGLARGIPDRYFIVANQDWVYQGGDVSVAGTFMHELGHTLGLRHGGCDDENHKPNYLSIMNYAYQTTGLSGTNSVDYSFCELPPIDENEINELQGIDPEGLTADTGLGAIVFYDTPQEFTIENISKKKIDFNCNGIIENNIVCDLNPLQEQENPTLSVLTGFNDWENLQISEGIAGRGAGYNESTSISLEEKTLEESLRTQTLATPGTGFLDFVGTTIMKGVDGQYIFFDVVNMGHEDASYIVSISSDLLVSNYQSEIIIPGSKEKVEKVRIRIPVNASQRNGEYTVSCTLSYKGKEDVKIEYQVKLCTLSNQTIDQLKREKDTISYDGIDADIAAQIQHVIDNIQPSATNTVLTIIIVAGSILLSGIILVVIIMIIKRKKTNKKVVSSQKNVNHTVYTKICPYCCAPMLEQDTICTNCGYSEL